MRQLVNFIYTFQGYDINIIQWFKNIISLQYLYYYFFRTCTRMVRLLSPYYQSNCKNEVKVYGY